MDNKQIFCKKCKSPHILRESRVTITEAHDNESKWEWVVLYNRLFDTQFVFICQACHYEWSEGESMLMNKPRNDNEEKQPKRIGWKDRFVYKKPTKRNNNI